jgi:hypothetical protein
MGTLTRDKLPEQVELRRWNHLTLDVKRSMFDVNLYLDILFLV